MGVCLAVIPWCLDGCLGQEAKKLSLQTYFLVLKKLFAIARLHTPTGMHTHPVWVVLQDSASCGVQLVVARSGSGLLVLPTLPLETLIAAERQTDRR